jgi:hypothetical protein
MHGFVVLDLATPIAVVCHDAGATNLIVEWLKAAGQTEVRAFMRGPAEGIWHTAFPEQPLCMSLEEALDGAGSLLSGTGWASKLEHQSRQMAQAQNIRTVAVLDHWVNYAPRFEREGRIHLPDEAWVADAYALALARETFPRLPVRQLENIYLNSQVSRVGRAPGNGTLLVILEPVRNNWGRKLEGEFQALEYLFENIDRLWPSGISRVLLRPHPSEPVDKYVDWVRHHPLAQMDSSNEVAAAISQADVVVGVESSALIIALAAGRSVYSSLPPWAPPLRLPQEGIQQIRHLDQI